MTVLGTAELSRLATMGRLFGVAVLVVSPFALVQLRRIRRDRRARRPAAPVVEAGGTALAPEDLAGLVGRITELAGSAKEGETFEITLPAAPTLEGRGVPVELVEGILADAVRRSSLDVIERHGSVWICRRIGPQPQ